MLSVHLRERAELFEDLELPTQWLKGKRLMDSASIAIPRLAIVRGWKAKTPGEDGLGRHICLIL